MNNDFTSKVYQDELIIITAAQKESLTPPKYRAMRRLAVNRGVYHEYDAKLFYEQGRFMEDFEDDYDYQGKFSRYFPTYQSMNNHQLRGYFSWRTAVRRGIFRKPPTAFFILVYIYELLNQIGVHSPVEGFYALKNVWTIYGDIAPIIRNDINLWLKDYVVYNNLDKSLLTDSSDTNFYSTVSTLLNCKSRSEDEVFSALNALSSYNLKHSRFFKQYPDDFKDVAYSAFSKLFDHYDKKGQEVFCEKYFGKFYSHPYYMFKSAVFYDRIRQKDFVYELDEFHKYRCENGKWICKEFFYYMDDKNRQIRMFLKNIDFLMRRKYNFTPALTAGDITAIQYDVISKAIDEYLEKRREAARPKIEIDVSRLEGIRKAALETQGKLLIEEPEVQSYNVQIPEKRGQDAETRGMDNPENGIGLNDIEYLFMKCLLYGQAYNGLIRSKGVLLSVLIDSINEKLFDRFGDTVIADANEGPEPVADYVEELKGIIGE